MLDLGAGTGWLSAWLCRFNAVQHIDALDSSRRNLEQMLPRITELMKGAALLPKIRPIVGLFYPLPVADGPARQTKLTHFALRKALK